MNCTEEHIQPALDRLRAGDLTLKTIKLVGCAVSKKDTDMLVFLLTTCPNAIERIYMCSIGLTDDAGSYLARFVTSSTTIKVVDLHNNKFTSQTYFEFARAMQYNTSLRELILFGNIPMSRDIDDAFLGALRQNQRRPADSKWLLYCINTKDVDFRRLSTIGFASAPSSCTISKQAQIDELSERIEKMSNDLKNIIDSMTSEIHVLQRELTALQQ